MHDVLDELGRWDRLANAAVAVCEPIEDSEKLAINARDVWMSTMLIERVQERLKVLREEILKAIRDDGILARIG